MYESYSLDTKWPQKKKKQKHINRPKKPTKHGKVNYHQIYILLHNHYLSFCILLPIPPWECSNCNIPIQGNRVFFLYYENSSRIWPRGKLKCRNALGILCRVWLTYLDKYIGFGASIPTVHSAFLLCFSFSRSAIKLTNTPHSSLILVLHTLAGILLLLLFLQDFKTSVEA